MHLATPGPRRRTGFAALAAILAGLAALPAAAQQSAPTRVAASQRLGVEVFAASPRWCTGRPEFQVVAERPAVFVDPEFAALMQQLGLRLVAAECPSAQGMTLSGTARDETAPRWRGAAEAAAGWVVGPVTQAAAPGGLDLDAPPPPSAAPTPARPPARPGGGPAPATQTPTALDPTAQRRAEAALGAAFDRFNPARRCWAATGRSEGSTATACIRIARAYRVETAGGPRVHLLLAGDGKEDCHACTGLIAFAVLDPAEPAWQVLATSAPIPDGSFGQATEAKAFALHRLGADRWGWVEKTGYFAQGTLEGAHVVYLQRDRAVVQAGQLPGDHGNTGNCEDNGVKTFSGSDCVDVSITLGVDASDPAATAYPVVLHATGKVGRRRVNGRFVAPFDERRFRYVAPGNVP